MRFTLYSRSWCHLCEDMLAALRALAHPGQAFDVEVIDVDADPVLEARFNELVPVLYGDLAEPELCHYFLDEAAVRAYVERQTALSA
ncbi:glutaredoxin family protein [Massilia sp. IC2-278]|uniref:glutaredoxin family protein n=1 Tax=Massilia sp. IC2-278 TaxID=2887200 RepID=UPI001E3F656F|nr:glutaredoxin family protein [Massilia sp. IC2-278]